MGKLKKLVLTIYVVCFTVVSVAAQSNSVNTDQDTLVVNARIVEIPGTFAPNDLYNYVYVMKYRVLEVIEGDWEEREILVGHYNPLIPRRQISGRMAQIIKGNVDGFQRGDRHTLTLVRPISSLWNEAVEDEYFDIDDESKFLAINVETLE